MSALWFDKIVEEILHLRFRHGWRQHGTRRADFLHRHAQFLRHVRHRQTASALRQIKAPNSKLQAPEKLQAASVNTGYAERNLGLGCSSIRPRNIPLATAPAVPKNFIIFIDRFCSF
jgi:hypothetical protein